MTRRRHWLVGAALVIAAIVAAVAWIATRPQPDLSAAAIKAVNDRIGKDTTVLELTEILGAPPGDYTKGNRRAQLGSCMHSEYFDDPFVPRIDWGPFDKVMGPLDPGAPMTQIVDNFNSLSIKGFRHVAWWGRTRSLVMVFDELNVLRAVLQIEWLRPAPATFVERCEDWLYERVYGKD